MRKAKIVGKFFEDSAYGRSRSERRFGAATCTLYGDTRPLRNHVFVQYIAASACVRLFIRVWQLAVSVARFVFVKRIRDFVVDCGSRVYRYSVWCSTFRLPRAVHIFTPRFVEKGQGKRRKRKTWRIEVRRLRASKGVLPRSIIRRRAARPIVRVEWFYFPTSSAWRKTEITVKWSSSTFRDRSTKDPQGWRGSPPSAGLDYHAGHGHESQVTENRVRPVWRLPTRSFFLLSSSFLTFFASHSCLLSFSFGTHVAFSLSWSRERTGGNSGAIRGTHERIGRFLAGIR